MRTEKDKPPAIGNHPQSWHHLGSAFPSLTWLEAPGEVSTLQHPLWAPRVPSPLLSLVSGPSLVTNVTVMTVPPSDDLSSAPSSDCLMCHITPSILDFPQDLRTAMALCKLESQGHPTPPLPPISKDAQEVGEKKKKIPPEQMVGGRGAQVALGSHPRGGFILGTAGSSCHWLFPKGSDREPSTPWPFPSLWGQCQGFMHGLRSLGSNPHLHPPQGCR